MKSLLRFVGYGFTIFAFLDFILWYAWPDPLMPWYDYTYALMGDVDWITPIILYFIGSFLIKLGSDDDDAQFDEENIDA
jgi:hypothetical protein